MNFGITTGTLTQTAFNANTDYLLANWRSLATNAPFEFTADTAGLVEKSTRRVRALSGVVYGVGNWRVSPWIIFMDYNMSAYIETTIFNDDVSAVVTFKTWDVYRNQYWIFNGRATFSELVAENITTTNNRFLQGYQIDFSNVSEASVS